MPTESSRLFFHRVDGFFSCPFYRIHKLEVDKLHTALAMLTPEEQTLIQALFFEERSESQMAVELGISQPAVYKRKVKILKKLKLFLKAEF